MRKMVIFIGMLLAGITCDAQQEYTQVKNLFYAQGETQEKRLNSQDDLSFLLEPLNELKLDKNYILSDFRPYYRHLSREWSGLRLYVRNKKTARPDSAYFQKEYARYRKNQKNGTPYEPTKGSVAYLSPFNKIRLTGTQMSIWQAYLLDYSSLMFGMRNEANYDKTFLITSAEDVDSIISLLSTWEPIVQGNPIDTTQADSRRKAHLTDVANVLSSLKQIKSRNLEPQFESHADSVTITHYAFREFYGLVQCKATILLNHKHHHVKDIKHERPEVMAKYRHQVWY
jgi:hypothetical protein